MAPPRVPYGSHVAPIVKLDPCGRVVQSFGAGLILWPYGMDVDRQGHVIAGEVGPVQGPTKFIPRLRR